MMRTCSLSLNTPSCCPRSSANGVKPALECFSLATLWKHGCLCMAKKFRGALDR